MTSLADRSIAALRSNHDDLAAFVPTLSQSQLTGPSGADEWSIAQVLSHLGSGSEIGLAGLRAALTGEDARGQEFNQTVWDRWNAMSPHDQAAGFVTHNAALVQAYEALTSEQRETLQIKLGFLPVPISLAALAGMRLSEASQHAWDVHAGLDPAAQLAEDAAQVVLEQFSGELSRFVGRFGKADRLSEPAIVDLNGFGLTITDAVSLSTSVQAPTASFTGPAEAALRLIGGRLKPGFTAADVTVTGNVTLDDLRAVFPGF